MAVWLSLTAAFAAESNSIGRFSSPEATLATYTDALGCAARALVEECFDPPTSGFYLPGPLKTERYRIHKKIVFSSTEANEVNARGVIPRAREGDVELQVERFLNGSPHMFSYWFRHMRSGWKTYSHTAWNIR